MAPRVQRRIRRQGKVVNLPPSKPTKPAKPQPKPTAKPSGTFTAPKLPKPPKAKPAAVAKPPAVKPAPSSLLGGVRQRGGRIVNSLNGGRGGALLLGAGLLSAGVEASGTEWGKRAKASREAGDETKRETARRALEMLKGGSTKPSTTGNRNDPYGAGGSASSTKPASRPLISGDRTTQPGYRPVVNYGSTPKPAPSRSSSGGGGGGSGGGGGGRVSSSSSPSSKPASSASASTSSTPAKPVDSSTDSWSINFLRSKRGLRSLAKAKPPSESPVGPVKDGESYARSIETKGIGPVKDGENYALKIGTKGTGPVKDGASYADLLKKKKNKGQ